MPHTCLIVKEADNFSKAFKSGLKHIKLVYLNRYYFGVCALILSNFIM